MVYIKRMVIEGFKSFAKKTEVLFDKGVNIFIGPNGSGKSNITDALCFALGRLSIKSMRASRARNLLFHGSKYAKPAKEASVELVFDNSDRTFAIDSDEISLKRIIRANGQGFYKLNNETKTRNEIIEVLAQAGIDPYGFNIILQGQIQSIIRMQGEERRKIIEEVAGISIYETRKEKALHELEKTEEKLKEIHTILREKGVFLKNLEKDKEQAEKYKELELNIKKYKASILKKRIEEKVKELTSIEKSLASKEKEKEKILLSIDKLKKEIEDLSSKITEINNYIQQVSGVEQDVLRQSISNLRAEVEGLKVRKENYENRKKEIERRISEISKSIPDLQKEIEVLKKESPKAALKAQELKRKKEELAEISEERKKILTLKTEINSLKEQLKDKEKQILRLNTESETILKQIEDNCSSIKFKDEKECNNEILACKEKRRNKLEEINSLNLAELENEKTISVSESEIKRNQKIKEDVEKIDICPLCQSKITAQHKDFVFAEVQEKIKHAAENKHKAEELLKSTKEKKQLLLKEIGLLDEKIFFVEQEKNIHKLISDKKEHLKILVEEEKRLKDEITNLESKIRSLESKSFDLGEIEAKYESKLLEIEELSSRTEEDLNTVLLYKERDIEQMQNTIKINKRDIEELSSSIRTISDKLKEKTDLLNKKEEQERELNEKFKKMLEERDGMQSQMQLKMINLTNLQTTIKQVEEQINYLKIGKAKIDAEKSGIEMDAADYVGIETISGSLPFLEERLKKMQETISLIGSINMRALEIFNDVKAEYDKIQEKVNILEKEKADILNIIGEIDRKKIRTFLKAFREINERFTNKISFLYKKGTVFLELENKKDIFQGGVNIVVRLAKGKYFDVTSMSGGEQTLVAISLLFAIQEYNPYHFYILDEIDAALDKRNSERLASLLNLYTKSGQYIIISHNDSVILNANVLYGVSIHEGISKILSVKLSEEVSDRQNNSDLKKIEESNASVSEQLKKEERKEISKDLINNENLSVTDEKLNVNKF